MRVYCEDQLMVDPVDPLAEHFGNTFHTYAPSAFQDAAKCKEDLKEKKTAPPAHRKSCFDTLITFLVDELKESEYEVQGPVLKPLQSLFNKMFIRRGQTS
eukprot:1461354-Ditylum_brightwellii.AAC.1